MMNQQMRSESLNIESRTSPSQRRATGLVGLAFTELWERFSFYGLQGILAFYLLYSLSEGGLALDAGLAASIVGAYGGAVYLAQILGAWMGDRVLAPSHMVFWGGVVITAGHIALAVVAGLPGLGLGLGLIVLGTGALKTNITSIVGFVLENDSDRRDAGFSYFYMAINIGAVVGPLATGLAQSTAGFHVGFALAAIGMVVALMQYVSGMKKLPVAAKTVQNPVSLGRGLVALSVIGALLGLLYISWSARLVNGQNVANVTALAILAASLVYFFTLFNSKAVTGQEKVRLWGFLPLFIVSAIYFGLLFQNFTTIAILLTERVDLSVGSWKFPAAWVLTAGPLAAVLITPILARHWNRRGEGQPGPAQKMSFGMLQIGAGYAFLLVVSLLSSDSILLLFMLIFMLIVGSSEVFVGPIGLSLATRISPEKYRSQLVAMIFLALAAGSSLSGMLGQMYSIMDAQVYFIVIIALSLGLGLFLKARSGQIQRALAQGLGGRP